MQASAAEVNEAFAYCTQVATKHYENFSVISWFLPKSLQRHVCALYAYCRGIDDLGDELQGDRLAAIAAWEAELNRCYGGEPRHPVFRALQETVQTFSLDRQDFLKLIEANRMDQVVNQFETYEDLRHYCTCSADPVGHLVLQLFGYRDADRLELSDHICTGLQLANFLQDISVDVPRGRLYIPLEDLRRFGVTRDDLAAGRFDDRVAALMAFEIDRTQRLFDAGRPLERMVPRRLGLQLSLYRLGGQAILDALRRRGGNPFPRPRVSKRTKFLLACRLLVRA
ncbi:MAG: squalene synthase HpnC [Alicyclobacillus sp.]|nr:squalene synthase HpnC [Alicyclobacillus sp.]